MIGPDQKLKNADIWPIGAVSDFEAAFTAAGFSPAVMSCASGIEENAILNDLVVFPNPAEASTTISVNLEASSNVTVEIYNLVGALVSVEFYNGEAGLNNFTLNTNALENGQYILSVSLDDVSKTQIDLNGLR